MMFLKGSEHVQNLFSFKSCEAKIEKFFEVSPRVGTCEILLSFSKDTMRTDMHSSTRIIRPKKDRIRIQQNRLESSNPRISVRSNNNPVAFLLFVPTNSKICSVPSQNCAHQQFPFCLRFHVEFGICDRVASTAGAYHCNETLSDHVICVFFVNRDHLLNAFQPSNYHNYHRESCRCDARQSVTCLCIASAIPATSDSESAAETLIASKYQ